MSVTYGIFPVPVDFGIFTFRIPSLSISKTKSFKLVEISLDFEFVESLK